jgi:signal transduction histidine kinase
VDSGSRQEALKHRLSATDVTGESRRLLIYCRVDLTIILLAAASMIAMRLWVFSDDWLYLVAGIAIILAGAMAWAGFLTASGHIGASLVVVMAANWIGLLVFTTLAPITLNFSTLFILVPALLAIPYLSWTGIRATFAGALLAVAAAAVMGRFYHGVGLEAVAPTWNLDALDLLALPTAAGLAGYVSWQNHRTLLSRARAVRESRARLVASTDRERRRIERDLHDGAQQHLVAAAMQVRVIQRLAEDPHTPVRPLLTQVSDGLHQAIVELRDLAHGIYPAQLTDHGLEAALRAAALECPLPIDIHARDLTRYPPEIETNAYFVCIEAIQNATKHAGPDAAILIDLNGRHGLSIDISDTGPGASIHTLRAGHGITNVTDRIAAIGGTLTITTPPHTGVHLHADIPYS